MEEVRLSGIFVIKSSFGVRNSLFSFTTLRSAIGTTDIVSLDFNPGIGGTVMLVR